MPDLELPHAAGCLVCGRANPHGLHLSLRVDPSSGRVSCDFVPNHHHVGFTDVIHGGALATVFDEAMVWAASWSGRRFCLCGEMTVRFRRKSGVGGKLHFIAEVESARPRLLRTTSRCLDETGQLVADATGKYVPLPAGESREFLDALIAEHGTRAAAEILRAG
jgi:acyl-coenzyme A thioesterase PaaI-like protein